ncbi:hypothetical protein FJY63_02130, partial [Candidatus Sumerlaeota bacterium]|nr:hypothetical protein [Candidatus Sumerlaeota bacterium]
QSAFAAALLLYLSVRHRDFRERHSYVLLAAALGLATLVRWQNLVLGLIPLAFWVKRMARREGDRPGRADFLSAALALAVFLVVFSPQMFYWHAQLGKFLTIPQGREFMRWGAPRFYGVLFSGWNGLFYWHPWFLLAAIGLLVRLRASRDRLLTCVVIVCVVLMTYVNGCTFDWFAGYSFGGRRFCGSFPLLALGLAGFYNLFRGRAAFLPAAITTVAAAANFVLHLAFTRDITDLFFAREFWSLRHDLFALLPQWIAAIHLNSQIAVYLLVGSYGKALLLFAAGLLLVVALLVLALKGKFLLLEKKARLVILCFALVALPIDLILLVGSPPRDRNGLLFARVLSSGEKMPEEQKEKILLHLIENKYANPSLYRYAVENLGGRFTLADGLLAVYGFSAQAWARWVDSLPLGQLSEDTLRKAAALQRQPFPMAQSFYEEQVRLAAQHSADEELRWLRRSFRFNPFDIAALRRAMEIAAQSGAEQDAREFQSRLQRFLEAKVHTFFAVERHFAPWQTTVFESYYLNYALELIKLYEARGQLERALELCRDIEPVAPGNRLIEEAKTSLEAQTTHTNAPAAPTAR